MWDVVIIGGSAAGLSAALMLGRARRSVLVIDAGEPRNRFAEQMHGVLGHDGLAPTELLRRGREEAAGYGAELKPGKVVDLRITATGCEVETEAGEIFGARRVLVATGLTDDLPDIEGLADRWGREVFTCPYCHGYEVRERRIGVVATTDQSFHHVQLIRQWSDKITLFSHLIGKVPDEMATRLRARGIVIETEPVEQVVLQHDALAGLQLRGGRVVELDAVATAGRLVSNDAFLDRLELERTRTPMGAFLTVDKMGRTSQPLVYAAGNVTNPGGAVPAAVGEGAMAGALINMALVDEDFDSAVSAVAA